MIGAFLDAPADGKPIGRPVPGAVSSHTGAEITFKRERRELGDGAYKARLSMLDDDLRMVAGESRTFDVEVANLGDSYWPGTMESHPQIHLGSSWIGDDGTGVEGPRTALGAPVHPGTSVIVPLLVAAPDRPDRHRLQIDLVHEHVRWFGCGVEIVVQVRDQTLH